MKVIFRFLVLLFLCASITFSQTNFIDSLKKETERTSDEKAKVKLLNKLGHSLHAVNPQEGLKHARQALEISKKIDSKNDIANAYLVIGECYYILSDYPKSIDNYQKSLKINEENGFLNGIATNLSNIAVIYEAQQDFLKATEYYKKALVNYEKMNNTSGTALILGNLGILYATLGDSKQAEPNFQKAIDIYEKNGDKEGIARNIVNLGELYKNEGNYKKALEYYNKALGMNPELVDKRGLAIIYLNIGETFSKQKKDRDAIEYFQKSLMISKEIDYKETMLYAYQNLSTGYEKLENFKLALLYNNLYVQLKDSVYNEANERKISNITAGYQVEKQEKENEALRERNQLQFIYFAIILALIVVILVITFLRYRIKQKSLKLITEKNRLIELVNKELEFLNQELSQSNASKDKFFQIISHELLNPVRWMSNITDMLPKRIQSMSVAELQELANVLNQTANQSNKLLENLLQWARLHTGRVVFNPEKLNLKEIVYENVEMIKSQLAEKKLSLNIEIPDDILIMADKNMLGAVVRNLIENSVKFTHEDGSISFSASLENGLVKVKVSDNGVGISSNDIEKLFKIDVHHSTEGTAKEKGTGFGLILCKEYIEKHGGSISVESQQGRGTTFFITIPGI